MGGALIFGGEMPTYAPPVRTEKPARMANDADNPCSGLPEDSAGFYRVLLDDSQRAWECLYLRAYRTFIPYACQRSAISTDDALDLLQEGLAEFAVKLKSGKYTFQGSAVTAYVFTVCRNRWVSFLKKKRLLRIELPAEDEADEADDSPAPAAFLSENEAAGDPADLDDERGTDPANQDSIWEDAEVDWEAVNRAFSELSQDCRTMLQCFYVEEKPLGECAGRIGLQENSGKVKRFRCAQRMKTLYSQYKIA